MKNRIASNPKRKGDTRSNRRNFLKTLGAGAAAAAFGAPRLHGRSPVPTVRFWDMRVGPEKIYPQAAEHLVGQYNAQNPSVQVSYESEEWTDWPQLFSLALSSGIAPDLSTGGSYQAMQYYDKGAILELDDLVADLKASGDDKDFLPGALDFMTYKGHTIALPWGVDLRVIYYRKDLFAKAGIPVPGSWREIREAARALTYGDQYGFVVSGTARLATQTLLALILNNGGGLFTADGEIDMMNDRNAEAFRFFSNLAKDGSMNPGSTKFGQPEAQQAFLSGRGAMFIDTMGMQTDFPDQTDKIGLLPPPTGPHGDKGTISWIPNVMIYKRTKNPDAAKAFLKWWSAHQKPMWTEGHCTRLPARASIAADPYFQNDPITKQILEQWLAVGKSPGAHKKEIFPALNDLEGNGPMMTLAHDLLEGRDVVASMQTAENRLKALMKYEGSY